MDTRNEYSKQITFIWFQNKLFLGKYDAQVHLNLIDDNPDMYEEMFLQPMFVDYQRVNKFFDKDRFLNWFDRNVYKGVLNG